ncbi:hypothetical protein F6455_07290 [Proteobacteria bacterium 005FR1]|nr:hypothetical protein [Proteobacteria bacterium 005FR1]
MAATTQSETLASAGMHADAQQQACEALLERLIDRQPCGIFASLTTIDGRSFAFATKHGEIQGQRVAAVSSSLLALSEAFGREILKGECSYTAIATTHGFIVTVRVPSRLKQHALSFCTDTSENMAIAMRLTFDTAEGLAKILDQAT